MLVVKWDVVFCYGEFLDYFIEIWNWGIVRLESCKNWFGVVFGFGFLFEWVLWKYEVCVVECDNLDVC